MPNSVHVHDVHVHPNLGHDFMPFHDATPLEKSEPQILSFKLWHGAMTGAWEDKFLQAQMSTLERIECYLGAFESGSRSFWGRKKGGFDAAPQWGFWVDLEQLGHSERNWKHGASQEITE